MGAAPGVEGGAVEGGHVSLMKLRDSNFPALERIGTAQGEDLRRTSRLSSGVRDHAAIFKRGHPVNCSPHAWLAVLARAVSVNVDPNLRRIVAGVNVGEALPVGSEDVRSSSLLDGKRAGNKAGFHLF